MYARKLRVRSPKRNAPRRLVAVFGAVVYSLVVFDPAGAQTIVGTASSPDGQPLPGVFVQLLDSRARPVLARLTDEAGRFLLTPRGPGEYRIRAELIGHDAAEMEAFRLEAGEIVVRDLHLAPAAIGLDAIEVVAESRCRRLGDSAVDVQHLWEEARRALTLSAWSARELIEFDVLLYERELDTHLQVKSHQSERRTGFGARPFFTLEPDQLGDAGYTRTDSSGTTYYAPDENVLLSDVFLQTHCFHARRGSGETSGLLGLSFRPVDAADMIDVEGTMWLDAVTSELRSVDYRYVGEAMPVRASEAGGRLDFDHLPGGAVIVRRWRIRVPVAAAQGRGARWFGPGRLVLTGFLEYGAEVVASRERRRLARIATRPAVIRGVARGPTGEPLPDAMVYLTGSPRATHTDEAGQFVLGAPPGRHELAIEHPLLRRLDAYGDGIVLELREDQTVTLAAPIAPAEVILARACPGTSGLGLVYGRITGPEGRAVGGPISVHVWVEEDQGQQPITVAAEPGRRITTRSDADGWYVACGVPMGRSVRVAAEAATGGAGSGRAAFREEPALARIDVRLQPRALAGPVDPDSVITLDPIVAAVPPRGMFGLAGFHRRKEQGIGRFIDRQDIEDRNPVRLTDLLREVPGLRLLCDPGACKIQFERAKPPLGLSDCPVLYFVDGTPFPMTFPDEYLAPDHIEGIEVHTSATVPAEYNRMVGSTETGSPRCGVILIWTRWR